MKFRFTLSHEVDTEVGGFQQAGLGTSWVGTNVSWVGSSESNRLYRLFAAQSISYTINYAWSAAVSGGSYSAHIGFAMNGVMVNFQTIAITGDQSGSVILTPSGTADSIAIRLTGSGASIDLTLSTFSLDPISDSQIIDPPDGWEDAVLKLERDENFHSLVEHFEGGFVFYGTDNDTDGGINFIREKEDDFGPDATIEILIEIAVDDINYETVFEGQLDLASKEEFWDNTMEVGIIREDFWAKFIKRLDTPVDIMGPGVDGEDINIYGPINIELPSQKIPQSYRSIEDSGTLIFMDEEFIQYQPDLIILDELEEVFLVPRATNEALPVWIFEAEHAGEAEFDFRIEYSKTTILDGTGHTGARTIYDFWFQLNDETPIEFTYQAGQYFDARVYDNWGIGNPPGDDSVETTIAVFAQTIQLSKSDVVRVYLQRDTAQDNNITFWGNNGLFNDKIPTFALRSPRPLGMIEEPTYFQIIQQTEAPPTNAEGFLVHDVAAAIADRIIGQNDTFYSDFLGSLITTARQYITDGCAWFYAVLKGLQIRQYSLSEKPFFMSFKQWWDGINPILNLGLGYETIDEGTPDEPVVTVFNDEQQLGTGDNWQLLLTPTRYSVAPAGFDSSKLLAFEIFGGVASATYTIGYDITTDGAGTVAIKLWDSLLINSVTELVIRLSSGNSVGNAVLVPSFIPKYVTFSVGAGGGVTHDVEPFTFDVTNLPDPEPFQAIRVEEKEHFYDDSETSVDFDNVRDISVIYDHEYQFNLVEIGYQKWNAEDVSGLDDPQTKRTYATTFKKIGQKISLLSQWIAASLTIEVTRRTSREKSADYKYDNDTFIIAVNPIPTDISPETSPDLVDFAPELDENFTAVENLQNSDTRYNLRLTPTRNLLRWINFLSGCLQNYLSSVFRFSAGEGNYDMESTMTDSSPECIDRADNQGEELSEKGNIPVSSEYLFIPEPVQIKDMPMTWEEYLIIRTNRKKAIGISQTTTGHAKFFIKTLGYRIVDSTADLVVWPKVRFDIQQIETVPDMSCAPASDDEQDVDCLILLETGDIMITEDNGLMLLEECGTVDPNTLFGADLLAWFDWTSQDSVALQPNLASGSSVFLEQQGAIALPTITTVDGERALTPNVTFGTGIKLNLSGQAESITTTISVVVIAKLYTDTDGNNGGIIYSFNNYLNQGWGFNCGYSTNDWSVGARRTDAPTDSRVHVPAANTIPLSEAKMRAAYNVHGTAHPDRPVKDYVNGVLGASKNDFATDNFRQIDDIYIFLRDDNFSLNQNAYHPLYEVFFVKGDISLHPNFASMENDYLKIKYPSIPWGSIPG